LQSVEQTQGHFFFSLWQICAFVICLGESGPRVFWNPCTSIPAHRASTNGVTRGPIGVEPDARSNTKKGINRESSKSEILQEIKFAKN